MAVIGSVMAMVYKQYNDDDDGDDDSNDSDRYDKDYNDGDDYSDDKHVNTRLIIVQQIPAEI